MREILNQDGLFVNEIYFSLTILVSSGTINFINNPLLVRSIPNIVIKLKSFPNNTLSIKVETIIAI